MISLIVAMTKNSVIGKNNNMPWSLPKDLQLFKKFTLNKPVIMGRKTFESIGRPLPSRTNIIISRTQPPGRLENGAIVVDSLKSAVTLVKDSPEIMVIGGAEIFKQALPLAQRLYLTEIQADLDGDTFFPKWDPQQWTLISAENYFADDKNEFDFIVKILEKNNATD